MGYNTVVLFSNDQIDLARKNAQDAMDYICTGALGGNPGGRSYGIQVKPPFHADQAPIFIGGANSLKDIGEVYWSQKDDIPKILRAIAERHGYSIAIRKRPQ